MLRSERVLSWLVVTLTLLGLFWFGIPLITDPVLDAAEQLGQVLP